MRFKKAFTLTELIFVIVLMGILAKFGFEFLAQSYNTFIFSKINNELQAKSNHTVEFIAKRLEARIAPSTIKRISSTNVFTGVAEFVTNPQAYNVLEWIGYDIDGYRGTSKPLWSGIIDFDTTLSSANQLSSANLDTTELNEQIKALSYDNSTIADIAIMFNAEDHNPQKFAWDGSDILFNQTKSIHPVTSTTPNIFVSSTPDNFSKMTIYNRYMLAWSAYAIVHDAEKKLYFYYDYQPWQGEAYSDADKGAKKVLLMENVSEFRIKPSVDGRVFTIKICIETNLTKEAHALCKEKTIF